MGERTNSSAVCLQGKRYLADRQGMSAVRTRVVMCRDELVEE